MRTHLPFAIGTPPTLHTLNGYIKHGFSTLSPQDFVSKLLLLVNIYYLDLEVYLINGS